MRLAWATDVHLDACRDGRDTRFLEELAACGAEAFLLGGDVADGPYLEEWLRRIDAALPRPIYFVLGNHDYWGDHVDAVEGRMCDLRAERLRWLPGAGVVALTATTGLIGHGGWGDARCGDFLTSPTILSDYVLILDLQEASGSSDPLAIFDDLPALRRKLHELGDRAAAELRPQIAEAARRFDRVFVLTHVPAFAEACWYRGQPADEKWLPGFVSRAMGDVIRAAAAEHPACRFTVLSGHTHHEGQARLLPNLEAFTQGARYGAPAFRMMEVE